ncbi:CubicO group peptidase (beta-lactamase class C family) [Luteibacter rhizovicinus]|uniref:CubicO group peptidase (Beta-lactamase class C family) n=1 Tax=Luteibacter rhizovicinus TaxID=242606 RepID=A0A4R3YY05_9GAMM|nr:serine hydrolase domain-containing protein [Luteibacter rhizovicinus]TCV97432.1 CubicO group peptidase (beta-lactamase class C family) [Luteibacter rhizovicinus]
MAVKRSLLAAFILATSGVSTVAAQDIGRSLDTIVQQEMRDRRIPGLQLAVVQHGRVVTQRSYGTANLPDSVPVAGNTVFSINSATKAFTGVALMQLVEAGRLNLDDPVSRYLPDLPQAWRPITVRQLATHMSGVPNIIDDETGELRGTTEGDAWKAVRNRPMDFAPGERFSYNQTNYVLLGKIIESLSGKPFRQVFEERQFKPASMTQTGFGDSRDVIPHKAPSYRYLYPEPLGQGELTTVYETFPPMLRTGAGINSTAADMAQWLIAVQAGRFVSRKTLAELWMPGTFNDGRRAEWAQGWVTVPRADHPAVGGTGGGRSAFYVYPEDDTAVVVLTNLSGGYPEEFIDEIAALYIPGMHLNGVARMRSELRGKDFSSTKAVYDELRRKDTGFSVSEDGLNNWAYRMLRSGKPTQAVEVFRLAVALYPASGNAYDSLAEGYEVIGKTDLAIANYKRSLELDPKNNHAVRQLQGLKAAGK